MLTVLYIYGIVLLNAGHNTPGASILLVRRDRLRDELALTRQTVCVRPA